MRILSLIAGPGIVSHCQEWPGPDTLTTFQDRKTIRVLIVGNTKRIFLIWKQRDILAQKSENSGKQRKHGIARKHAHCKVPFESRINTPNSRGRSGSFGTRLGYPALVRVSISENTLLLDEFSCFRLFLILSIQACIDEDLASLMTRMAERVNNGQIKDNNGQRSQ